MHDAARPRASRLHAGAAGKDNHDVLAETVRHLLLPDPQPLAGGHHEGDRDDSPGDAEHGEEGTQLVRP